MVILTKYFKLFFFLIFYLWTNLNKHFIFKLLNFKVSFPKYKCNNYEQDKN